MQSRPADAPQRDESCGQTVDNSIEEKMKATAQLTREVYRWAGVDVDKPMDKTIRIITWAEKNRAHEEAQRLYERYQEAHK